MVNRIKVTISDAKRIPTIGKGPIKTPICITQEQYNLLTLLGFSVKTITEETTLEKRNLAEEVEEVIEEVEGETVEEVVEETEEVEGETVEEVVEETEEVIEDVEETEEFVEEVEDETVEEVVEETEDEETVEVDINVLTKKELKAELDKRNVEYTYNATVAELKELLKNNL